MNTVNTIWSSFFHSSPKMILAKEVLPPPKGTILPTLASLINFNPIWLGKTQISKRKWTFCLGRSTTPLTTQKWLKDKIPAIFGFLNQLGLIEAVEFKFLIPLNSFKKYCWSIWRWWTGKVIKKSKKPRRKGEKVKRSKLRNRNLHRWNSQPKWWRQMKKLKNKNSAQKNSS